MNKEILRLALPSILANITIPLVGMVDMSVAGHLQGGDVLGAAAFIGGISLGSMLFDLLYWNFFFLRTGTGGLTAQAFGRGDFHECSRIFARGIVLSIVIALATLAIQVPFVKVALLCTDSSAEVEELALRYFYARVWAAPATLSLMAFRGWFVGMQDSASSMFTDLIVNGVNIAASILLTFGFGSWDGMGYVGIAWGTAVAQYCGLLYATLVCIFKYGRRVFGELEWKDVADSLKGGELRRFLKMNADLLVRSLCFTAIYVGFTMISTVYGDVMLACGSIMMKLLMIFSYFTDGFAYAGEALTGRFIGERNKEKLHRAVRYVFIWSMAIAVLFVGIYVVAGEPMLRILTSDRTVISECVNFLPWLLAMPLIGCAAFTWDGIYLGATSSATIRNAMAGATVSFFAVWFVCKAVFQPSGTLAIHLLLAAYFAHLIFRTVYLSVKWPECAANV